MKPQPIVDARAVHKHFGALHVLKGVDLKVAERELVFVIGPSGSGKSTLLRCLNRLEEPSSGSIVVDGIDMLDPRTDINHARQRIGMVFQSFNLYPHMTALGNVTLALRKVAGKSRAEADRLGRAALERGLVDRIGGVEDAVARVRVLTASPVVRRVDVRLLPRVPLLTRLVRRLFGSPAPALSRLAEELEITDALVGSFAAGEALAYTPLRCDP